MVFKESDMDSIAYFRKVQNEILKVLRERYKECGEKNFVFKSKRISRVLGYDTRIIGRTLSFMNRDESGIKIEKHNKSVPILWRTNFDD